MSLRPIARLATNGASPTGIRAARACLTVGLTIALALSTLACGQSASSPSPTTPSMRQQPDPAACISTWNSGASSQDRGNLDVQAAQGSADVAMAAYTGSGVDVTGTNATAGNGPTPTVRIAPHACVLIAGTFVFIRQPDGSWASSEAILTQDFSEMADPAWTEAHANAKATIGPLNGDPISEGLGTLAPLSGANIVSIGDSDVNGTPDTSPQAAASTACPGGISNGTGAYVSNGGLYDQITATGITCATALQVVRGYGESTGWSVQPQTTTVNDFTCVTTVGPAPGPDNNMEGQTTCTRGSATARFVEPPGD